MDDKKIIALKERIKRFKKVVEDWNERQFLDINSIPFDEACTDLLITNSTNMKSNEPIPIRIFNNTESIIIGLIVIPNQFDKKNTEEQMLANFEGIRDQFDALLFRSANSSFTDLGFKEIVRNDDTNAMTHYRNPSIDFESFKDVFKNKSRVIMRTALASGTNRSIKAVQAAFTLPDFYTNQIIELKNTILCISTGENHCTNNEINDIGIYCLDQIKRGAILSHVAIENLSLNEEVRVSVLISGFDEAN